MPTDRTSLKLMNETHDMRAKRTVSVFPNQYVCGVKRLAVSLTLYLACRYKVEIGWGMFPKLEKIFDKFLRGL